MLVKLRVVAERKFVHPMFKRIDKNNSGLIEFEEFEAFFEN